MYVNKYGMNDTIIDNLSDIGDSKNNISHLTSNTTMSNHELVHGMRLQLEGSNVKQKGKKD